MGLFAKLADAWSNFQEQRREKEAVDQLLYCLRSGYAPFSEEEEQMTKEIGEILDKYPKFVTEPVYDRNKKITVNPVEYTVLGSPKMLREFLKRGATLEQAVYGPGELEGQSKIPFVMEQSMIQSVLQLPFGVEQSKRIKAQAIDRLALLFEYGAQIDEEYTIRRLSTLEKDGYTGICLGAIAILSLPKIAEHYPHGRRVVEMLKAGRGKELLGGEEKGTDFTNRLRRESEGPGEGFQAGLN